MSFQSDFTSALKASGLSHKEAAAALNTAPGTITRWLHGHSAPAAVAQAAILKLLEAKTGRDQTDLKRIARLLAKRVEALETIRMCLETKRPIPDICHDVILETAGAFKEAQELGIVETTLYDEHIKGLK